VPVTPRRSGIVRQNRSMDRTIIEAGLAEVLRTAWQAPELVLEQVDEHRDRSAEAGQPWLEVKYGPSGRRAWHGVVPVTVTTRSTPGADPQRTKLAIKVNPVRGVGETLIPWIVERASIDLPRPYGSFRTTAEARATGEREVHLYELGQAVPALRAVLPPYLGRIDDPASGEHALVLGWVELDGLDASGAHLDWPPHRLEAAARAAACWHAALADHVAELSWAAPRPSTADRVADADLYAAVLEDAHRRFPEVVTDAMLRRRHALLDTLSSWHQVKDELVAAHNDYNARNVGFAGPRPIALDWEIARIDTPTRDLVELLTFGLGPGFDPDLFHTVVEAARSTLHEQGVPIDAERWRDAVRAEVRVEALDRVGMQSLFETEFALPYFTRIQTTVERLLDLTD
jgi:hypothetical protein